MKKFILFISLIGVQLVFSTCTNCCTDDTHVWCCGGTDDGRCAGCTDGYGHWCKCSEIEHDPYFGMPGGLCKTN